MIRITIRTDNAAFEDHGSRYEIARILHDLAHRFERSGRLLVQDLNGHTVGDVKLTAKDAALAD